MNDPEGRSRSSEMATFMAIYHLLLMVNVSILHRFRDITTFTVNVTSSNRENSFSFDTTFEISGHTRLVFH